MSAVPGPDAIMPLATAEQRGSHELWQALVVLNLYRLALSVLLVGLYVTHLGPRLLGEFRPLLYLATAWAFLGSSLAGNAAVRLRWPHFGTQVHLLVICDVLALTLLMHASGGVISGLGILLIITITSGGLVATEQRVVYVYAALATLAILAETVYADLTNAFPQTYFTQAGMLGAAFFATALLAHVLARRARFSEQLAAQRGVDLANLAQLNEHIIQRLQSGILVVDDDGRVRLMNQAAWHLLGMPLSGSQPTLEEIAPELADQLEAWRESSINTPQPFAIPGSSHELLPRFTRLGRHQDSGTLIYLDDQRAASQQLQQVKLASLGRMSASIAHEIRNPLGALSHAAQLLDESANLGDAERRLARIIEENSQRVNTVIETVLQISRRQTSRPTEVDLKAWLTQFKEEFCNIEGLDSEALVVDVQPPHTCALIDTSQLHQVVWNLSKNALDHGRGSDGRAHIELRAGQDARARGSFLEVIDHGPGIDPQTAEQIFEPFYTTRTRGTGLGLYLARQLCTINDASLNYVAQPRGGSCFRIQFPNAPDPTMVVT